MEKRIMRFTVPHTFPGMNEIITAAKSSRYGYSAMKKRQEGIIRLFIPREPMFTKRVKVSFLWIEPHELRDCDNICAAKKFFLAALKTAKIIRDDKRLFVSGLSDDFLTDKRNPRVVVTIEEE